MTPIEPFTSQGATSSSQSVTSWGGVVHQHAHMYEPMDVELIRRLIQTRAQSKNKASNEVTNEGAKWIARGMGRSYGDSALASNIFGMTRMDHLIDFDRIKGIIQVEAGVGLADLLATVVAQGWMLPVTPGTKNVSVGGAIASDVHGKNHHHDGCFGQWVNWLDVLVGDGRLIRASPHQHADLFHATCGGMGLTGVIVAAELMLKPIISPMIHQVTIKTGGLRETLEMLEQHQSTLYSVAWLDSSQLGANLGRAHIMLGEHSQIGADLTFQARQSISMPQAPQALLNPWVLAGLNRLYYHQQWRKRTESIVPLESYFYPLDVLGGWSRLYGKRGMTQYHFVVPASGINAMVRSVIEGMHREGVKSFLNVLKATGPKNTSPLSFPIQGFSLAVDMPWCAGADRLMKEWDTQVAHLNGRVYLTKDNRMQADTFRMQYPEWEAFEAVREAYGSRGVFESLQSKRLGLGQHSARQLSAIKRPQRDNTNTKNANTKNANAENTKNENTDVKRPKTNGKRAKSIVIPRL